MDQQLTEQERTEQELDHPAAREMLESQTIARLAYDGTDGTPRVIPIGFLWTRGRIVVCTSTASHKVPALRARPAVAATLDVGDTPADARALLIRGTATLDTVDGVPDEFLQASAKSLRPEELAGFEAAARGIYPQMMRISIEPTWARYYDFGIGRMPGFMQDMAAGAAG